MPFLAERDRTNAAASRTYMQLLDLNGSIDRSECNKGHLKEAKTSSSMQVELGSVHHGGSLGARIEFLGSHLDQSVDQLSNLGAWMGEDGAADLTNDDFFNDPAFEMDHEARDEQSAFEGTAKLLDKTQKSSERK